METVLITGCSSGIGAATARRFREGGWTVYATARDPGELSGLADAGCETAALDVTDGEQVEAVVDRVLSEVDLDCLVNNAGYGQLGPIEDVPTDEVHRQFDVNVYGPHRLLRAVLPHMRERGEGTVINVSSTAGRVAAPGTGVYAGSKFALEAMSDALRAEVAASGVDVVLVEPGGVETDFDDRAERELPLARSDAYAAVYSLIEDASLLAGGSPFARPPDAVADAIYDAATCADPAPRYPVGPLARPTMLARFLPARWRDAAYRLVARLV